MRTENDIAIKVSHLSKVFYPQSSSKTVKEAFVGLGRKLSGRNGLRHHEGEYRALNDINFEIKKGEFFGIVGRNGSGKSTLLKILAGVYSPTKGHVQVNGKLTPFIELGVGFNPELSGRDNVFLNGALLGFTRKQMADMYDEIVDFAELHDFMDTKLKNYSSGMQVRLAFSVAIRAKSEILLIDEVLAVGDALFQQKCYDYFSILKRRGTTVAFVSHDTAALRRFCSKGILINDKKKIFEGDIEDVIAQYNMILNENLIQTTTTSTEKAQSNTRWGNGLAKIDAIETKTIDGKKRNVFKDEDICIELKVKYLSTPKDPVVGIVIKALDGTPVFASNTLWSGVDITKYGEGDTFVCRWTIPNYLNTGSYTMTPAVAYEQGMDMCDWVDDMAKLTIRKTIDTGTNININHRLEIK